MLKKGIPPTSCTFANFPLLQEMATSLNKERKVIGAVTTKKQTFDLLSLYSRGVEYRTFSIEDLRKFEGLEVR